MLSLRLLAGIEKGNQGCYLIKNFLFGAYSFTGENPIRASMGTTHGKRHKGLGTI